MSGIVIRIRNVQEKKKDLLEIRFLFWNLKKGATPSFELSYSEDDSTHPNFKPKREGSGTPQAWVARIEQLHFAGTITAKAWDATPHTGDPSATSTFPAGSPVQPTSAPAVTHVLKLPVTAPTILPAVNADNPIFPALVPFTATAVTPSHILEITRHIFAMMVYAPQAAWESMGLDAMAHIPVLTGRSDLSAADLDECWAQTITEVLAGIPYAGPTALSRTPDLFKYMVRNDDPVVPIVGACEHLVTMGLISRGFDALGKDPVGSHGGASSTLPGRIGGDFASASTYRDVVAALRDVGLRPGSVYHFSQYPHIAFILRTFPNQKIQFFDTGAMNSPGSPATPEIPNAPGNQDYPWFPADPTQKVPKPTQRIVGPAGTQTYEGLWVAPAPSNATLAAAVDRLRRSRPFGLARLVLRDRKIADPGAASFLYSSPLLPMCTSIFRHLFSLRNHPYCDRIEARWYIGVPQGDTLVPEFLANRNFANTWGGRERNEKIHGSGKNPDNVVGVVDLASRSDGKVAYVGRYSTGRATMADGTTFYDNVEFWKTSATAVTVLNWPATRVLPAKPAGAQSGSRPAAFEALPIGRAPSAARPGGLDGVLAEHEAYGAAKGGGAKYPNKVLMGDTGRELPPYLLGTDG